MSNYFAQAYNPKTGKLEEAEMWDDYFGPHKYAVRFKDGEIYREEEVRHKT